MGKNWRAIETVGNVPKNTYVNQLLACQYDKNTVFAVFNNHKNGDFKPYIYKSSDKGNIWVEMQVDLPERGSVYDISQDHVDKNLFFAGTELGVFFSKDAGQKWQHHKAHKNGRKTK